MNKLELIAAMAEKSGLPKTDTKKALEAFVATVSETLAIGNRISLIGFGTFYVQEKGERQGINPSTKQIITIAPRKTPKFKAGGELTNAVK